jgi:signal transduction histidine kinase
MTSMASARRVGRHHDPALGRILLDPAERALPRWQVVAALLAVALAVAAVWVTLRADFLAHREWLAVQKADFVLGPAITGLYWLRRRPESRFGPMLLAFAFVGAVYILQSSSDPWLFSIGLMWENLVGLATYVLILAFPTGRLDGVAAKVILAAAVVAVVAPAMLILLLLPEVGAGGSISGCLSACPHNELALASDPRLASDLFTAFRYSAVAVALAVTVLLVWRFATGTPPRRRALAIGTPVALLFLAFQIAFQVLGITGVTSGAGYGIVIWGIVAARAALWYGFLFALIAAELFAGRALRRMVMGSLRRPPQDELEAMLRDPLGDPRLELRFADPRTGAFGGGARAGGSAPPPGREVTLVESEGAPAVAIVHDAQLNDDPELLRAAGAVALLASENAELDSAWSDAVKELQRSRRRIVRTADDERRKFERDLHDGVQQQLISMRIRAGLAGDRTPPDDPARQVLEQLGDALEATLDDVRQIGHGLYPPVLTELGLAGAIERVRSHSPAAVTFSAGGIGRYPSDVESAVYYCCREAIQNAVKHGGPDVHVSVALHQDDGTLRAEVTDDGPGFDPGHSAGTGLQNMQDRLGALGGRLRVDSETGRGTTVTALVPAHTD